MRVVVATNEPWGTYHCEPLVTPAAEADVELVQWVPDLDHLPVNRQVEAAADIAIVVEADLVVVNGLFSDHTRQAADFALEHGVPLCLSELAFLRAQRALPKRTFALVQANSPATALAVGIHSDMAPSAVEVVGWPALDTLPERVIGERQVVALTGVSKPTVTGGHHQGDEHEMLFAALISLEAEGYEIAVRRHPRETDERWSRWQLREDCTTAEALNDAALVVGLAGTPAFYTAAYQIPFLGIVSAGLPDYLASAITPLERADDVVRLAQTAPSVSEAQREWICGPIGGAAERMISGWFVAAS